MPNKPRDNLLGRKAGRLLVTAALDWPMWRCSCECGGEAILSSKAFRSGKTNSCGCLRREVLVARNTKHGLTVLHPKEYRSWKDMRARCQNKNDSDFKDYGGRGIKVTQRWDDFAAFYADMGDRPPLMTLDRVDVNRDYGPNNCRWASAETQANNKRTNRVIEWRGERKTLSQWCRVVGMEHSKAAYRLKQGWPVEDVFSLEDFRR